MTGVQQAQIAVFSSFHCWEPPARERHALLQSVTGHEEDKNNDAFGMMKITSKACIGKCIKITRSTLVTCDVIQVLIPQSLGASSARRGQQS
jgi:hypothetical protein